MAGGDDIGDSASVGDSARFWHHYGRYPYLLAKVALWTLVAVTIYWFLHRIESVVFPLLASLLIAYLLDPAVDRFEERGIARTVAIIIFIVLILIGLGLFVLVLYPAIASQVTKVIDRFPQLVELIQTKTLPWLQKRFHFTVPSDLSDAMSRYGDSIKEQLPDVAKKVSQWLGGLVTQTGAVISSILNLVMIPIFTFYFLRDFDRMTASLARYVPPRKYDTFIERARRMDEVVGAWFRGQVQVAGILGVLYATGLGIVFGVTGIGALTGVAIGILAGLLNIIPYFGFLTGFVLSVLMVLLDWGGWGPLVAVLAVFTVVQLLEGYVITPKIVGEKVGLSPVMVIIVLLIGGELFGLVGVLLAIPAAGIIRVLLPELIAYYETTPFYSGDFSHAGRSPAVVAEMATAGEGPGDGDEANVRASSDAADGTVDHEDVADEAPRSEGSDAQEHRHPVTADASTVDERDDGAPTPMDEGTDGDVEEEVDDD